MCNKRILNLKVEDLKRSFLFLAGDACAAIKWGFMSHPMARNSLPGCSELSLYTKLAREREKERKKERRKERRARIGEVAAVEWSPVAECYSSQLN